MISPNDTRKLSDKLMILYAYYIYDAAVDIEVINKILLSTDLFDYFVLASLNDELINDKLIQKSQYFEGRFEISKLGIENLEALIDKIKEENKKKITRNVELNKQSDISAKGIIANYNKVSENDYQVHLKLMSKQSPVIEINLKAPTNSMAQKIINAWNSNAINIFNTLLNEFDKSNG